MRSSIDEQIYQFTPFLIWNARFTGQKNKKISKVNSRDYTYDGLTFSIESAMVKDALVISNAPLYETHLFVFGTHSQRFIAWSR